MYTPEPAIAFTAHMSFYEKVLYYIVSYLHFKGNSAVSGGEKQRKDASCNLVK